ncbi:MAG TPA: adenylate/guanylate cyclase domain-containing protein, partial [Nonomuraea sp.]|nr:adenylate/guanylate cyclase domain-containing protein [Nonomuraea sp.]
MGRFRRTFWHRAAILLLVAITLTSFASAGRGADVFLGNRNQAADSLFPRGRTDPRVVVVSVDEQSVLEAKSNWPWPRDLQAQLAERLFDAGVKVIAFDIQFDSPGPGDDRFAAAMRRGKVVLAQSASDLGAPVRKNGARVVGKRSLSPPTPALAAAAAGIGLVNVLADPDDGVVRAVPLVVETETEDLPSLSLGALMAFEGVEGPLTQRPFGVQVGDRVIPTERQQTLRINYSAQLAGGKSRAVVSARDVLAGRASSKVLRGAVAFVGAGAPILGDQKQTPVNKANGIPGVFIHANALNTILSDLHVRDASERETLAWIFVLSLLMAALAMLAPLKVSIPVPVLLGAGYFVYANARFEVGVVMDFVYPVLAMTVALIAGLGIRYLTEGRHRRRAEQLFSQYVNPAVVKQLLEADRLAAAMEGQRIEVSVLFCDLRGFTAQSAKMEPAEVREMLEVYYLHLGQLVLDHGGTLMQYVGDEIFAVFGAPLPADDHAARAVACAIAMQGKRPEIGRLLSESGLPPIFYGIGLNCGPVVAAHVGSIQKQYAVIGDTVNIGARLCSHAREDQVCFPEGFRERLPEVPELEDLGPVEFKNATRPIQVWRYSARHP